MTLKPLMVSLFAAMAMISFAADTTGVPGLKKLKDQVIYQAPEYYSAFPSVTVLPDGELLCAFRRAPSRKYLYGAGGDSHTNANSYLVSLRSKDNGETWTSSPRLLYAHPFGGSQDPCLFTLDNGELLCTSYGWATLSELERAARPRSLTHEGFGFLGGYVVRSMDGGRTWGDVAYPLALPGNQTQDLQGRGLPTYNRGALCQLKDGSVAWAVVKHDTVKPLRTSVHLITSMDRGTSWSYVGPIAADEDRSFNETSLLETKNGDLVAFLRTDDSEMKAAMAVSRDGGQSFEPWVNLGWSGLPLQAINLTDGRILVVYGYRAKPYGIRARIIKGDLSDAQTAPEFILRDDGGSGDLGYPWAVQLADGRVMVVYYFNVHNGQRHIAATWLEVSPDTR